MPSTTDLASPTEIKLTSAMNGEIDTDIDNGKVKMKKHMGLLEGVAIILGIIFGSGIFISPKGIIEETNSVGLSLVVWVLCGLLSMIGALCYAELGTSIPKSGGDYAYINEAFGALPSFLYLWAANIIFVPTTNAIMGLTFANYVIQPFFPQCKMPDFGVRLVAACIICFLSFLNGFNVKATVRLQNVFMFCKIGALVLIIIIGVVWMSLGNVDHFQNSFADSTTNPGKIAKAFYSGIFTYSGWNYLNFMTEELKNPFVNLPRAIFISLPLVTGIYVLANMAYLSALTPDELLSSDAIAVTFGNAILGKFSVILPIMVAISAFGGLSVHIMTSSRMLYVGARNGHFPVMLGHLNLKNLTPLPSLIFLVSSPALCLFFNTYFIYIPFTMAHLKKNKYSMLLHSFSQIVVTLLINSPFKQKEKTSKYFRSNEKPMPYVFYGSFSLKKNSQNHFGFSYLTEI
nr:unnamed protein product [Callosobruchus analis]